jgi:hypothetical protein
MSGKLLHITEKEAERICHIYDTCDITRKALQKRFGISETSMDRILRGDVHAHISSKRFHLNREETKRRNPNV